MKRRMRTIQRPKMAVWEWSGTASRRKGDLYQGWMAFDKSGGTERHARRRMQHDPNHSLRLNWTQVHSFLEMLRQPLLGALLQCSARLEAVSRSQGCTCSDIHNAERSKHHYREQPRALWTQPKNGPPLDGLEKGARVGWGRMDVDCQWSLKVSGLLEKEEVL